MEEKILALAAEMPGGEASELLRALCRAAEAAWTGRLREGVTPADCGEALCCAAAFTAAADYLLGRDRGGIACFTAGEVSIQARAGDDAGLAEALCLAAERIMAPYGEPEGFDFRGVPG